MENLDAIVEGLIFMAGEEGLSLVAIQSVIQEMSKAEIYHAIQRLQQIYSQKDRGIELVSYGGKYKFVTKEFCYPYGKKLFESLKTNSLSQAALETLAIIAYNEPITRVEIEEIRGVGCEVLLKKLLNRNLIETRGRKDAIGKPLLYGVTSDFMDAFELKSLEELPKLETKENQDLFER